MEEKEINGIMLLDFEYSKGKIILSEVDNNGDIKMSYYPWRKPKKYVSCSESDPEKHPKYRTWDRKPVKVTETTFPNRFSIYEFLDRLPDEDKDRIFSYKEPKIFFVDIETEILDSGFVQPIEANSKVLTIAIVHNTKTMVLGLKPLAQKEIERIKNNIEEHFDKFDFFKVLEFEVEFNFNSFNLILIHLSFM